MFLVFWLLCCKLTIAKYDCIFNKCDLKFTTKEYDYLVSLTLKSSVTSVVVVSRVVDIFLMNVIYCSCHKDTGRFSAIGVLFEILYLSN